MDTSLAVTWDKPFVGMMRNLKKFVTQLQIAQPNDAYGRPTVLIDPQSVLSTGFITPIDTLMDNPPEGLIQPIQYMEGLPTIQGQPLWGQLEGEPVEFYNMFRRYREMNTTKENRAVYKLALEVGLDVRYLELVRTCYQWPIRVQAYDAYMAQERADILERRRQEVENKHAQAAETLFSMSTQYLQENYEMLTPKVAMQMMDLAVKLERLSLGMGGSSARGDAAGSVVNIQNNVQTNGTPVTQESGLVTGNLDADKERLSQVLNVMNKLGLMHDESAITEAEYTEENDGADD